MATLVKDRPYSPSLLAYYHAVDGWLTDPYAISFQVWSLDGDSPSQILPVAGGWTDASAAPFKIRDGCFVVRADDGSAWAPSTEVADLQVLWRIQSAEGDEEQYCSQRHEVVNASVAASPSFGIATVADVKSIGGGVSGLSAAAIYAALRTSTEVALRYCGHHFWLDWRRGVLAGAGGKFLHLQVPVLASSILANDSSVAVDQSRIWVRTTGEHQRNPALIWVAGNLRPSWEWDGPAGWAPSRRQVVTGAWGFVDEQTQQAPLPVRQAVAKLTYSKMTRDALTDAGGGALAPSGPVRSETTDYHHVTYAGGDTSIRTGSQAVLGYDPAVRDALDMFRRPILASVTQVQW